MSAAANTTVFGSLPDGRAVERVELATPDLRLGVLTFGASVQSLVTRDRDGVLGDVVLGFDELAPYLGRQPSLGATVGRYANRIAGAAFELGGRRFDIPANDGANALHGGPDGFSRRVWELVFAGGGTAAMRLVSPAGDMGFPGRLEVTAVFSVDGPVVRLETTATTDAPTVVNLTNHAYFNLHGRPDPGIADHLLTIAADHYLAVDGEAIPLPGPPAPVAGTVYDFRTPQPVGRHLHASDPRGAGFDHTFVLGAPDDSGLRQAALLSDPCSGRTLRVRTCEPGVQFYSGNSLDGSLTGRGGVLGHRSALCLETQHFPNAPNRPDYPTTVLRPGETFHSVTEWTLGAA